LAEYYTLPKKLQGVKAHPNSMADKQAQLQFLIGKRFIATTTTTRCCTFRAT